MIISFTLLFGAVGYLCYKSKKQVLLIDVEKIDPTIKKKEEDDLYKDLEDLFI